VQLLAYDWRQALGGYPCSRAPRAAEPADLAAVQGTLDHWQQVLVQIGFLDPAAPKKLMPRLQQLALRAGLTPQEVHILRGVARLAVQPGRPPALARAEARPGQPVALQAGRDRTGYTDAAT
jgi:tRNA/rRNA methyltransferase